MKKNCLGDYESTNWAKKNKIILNIVHPDQIKLHKLRMTKKIIKDVNEHIYKGKY